MKTTITKPLIQFIVVTTILTVLFRISLSELLNRQLWNYVFIPPVIYFISMTLLIFYFCNKYLMKQEVKLLLNM